MIFLVILVASHEFFGRREDYDHDTDESEKGTDGRDDHAEREHHAETDRAVMAAFFFFITKKFVTFITTVILAVTHHLWTDADPIVTLVLAIQGAGCNCEKMCIICCVQCQYGNDTLSYKDIGIRKADKG